MLQFLSNLSFWFFWFCWLNMHKNTFPDKKKKDLAANVDWEMRSSLFTISKGSVQLTNISIICTWKQKEPCSFSQQSSMSPLTGDKHRLFTWVKQFTSLQVHLCHSQYIIINIHTLTGWKTFLWPTNLKVETDYQTICATQILISTKDS